MTVLTNSFEGGSNTTTITTGNSGGTSGNAFDNVSITGTNTLTYSSTQSFTGLLSCAVVSGSPVGNSLIRWGPSLTGSSVPAVWFRAYVFLTAGASACRIIRASNNSYGTLCGWIEVNSSAKLILRDAAGNAQATSNTALPNDAWVRLEGYVIGSAVAGQLQLQIFKTTPNGLVPDEVVTTAATLNTNGAITGIDYGNPSSTASTTFYLDNVGVSTTGYLGPASAVTLTNSFEGGTNGTTITTSNSGGLSGDVFDLANTGSGATLAFDNTHAAHGKLAMTCAASSLSQASVGWSTSLGTAEDQLWFRVYMYFTANPAGNVRVLQFAGGGGQCAFLRLTFAGNIAFCNAASTAIVTFTNTIPLNAWFRLEGFCIGDPNYGQVDMSLYNVMDSVTPTETQTSAATQNTVSVMTQVQAGYPLAGTGQNQFWVDDFGVSTTGFLGPVVVSRGGSEASIIPVIASQF
jgi:hypothetical protein